MLSATDFFASIEDDELIFRVDLTYMAGKYHLCLDFGMGVKAEAVDNELEICIQNVLEQYEAIQLDEHNEMV